MRKNSEWVSWEKRRAVLGSARRVGWRMEDAKADREMWFFLLAVSVCVGSVNNHQWIHSPNTFM